MQAFIGVVASVVACDAPIVERSMAIALRYGCDLAEHEVASAMGIAPGTAAATLHQARRCLRSILSEGTTDD